MKEQQQPDPAEWMRKIGHPRRPEWAVNAGKEHRSPEPITFKPEPIRKEEIGQTPLEHVIFEQ